MERTDVFQWKHTISVPRESFLNIVVTNKELDENDLRVCIFLLTELDGWSIERARRSNSAQDPFNFKAIDIKKIAKTLKMDKKDVKTSIKMLVSLNILEKGGSRATETGYRFTF